MIHSIKCYPDYFKALKDGTKTFEVRKKTAFTRSEIALRSTNLFQISRSIRTV